jgi:hypothetical protein
MKYVLITLFLGLGACGQVEYGGFSEPGEPVENVPGEPATPPTPITVTEARFQGFLDGCEAVLGHKKTSKHDKPKHIHTPHIKVSCNDLLRAYKESLE